MNYHYDPETGIFTRTSARNPEGIVVGSKANGYLRVGGVLAHRRAYEIMTGHPVPEGMDIDHIDRDRSNNRWSNLRLVSRADNLRNQTVRKNNKLGEKCISMNGGRYRVQIMRHGKYVSHTAALLADAIAWRDQMLSQYECEAR